MKLPKETVGKLYVVYFPVRLHNTCPIVWPTYIFNNLDVAAPSQPSLAVHIPSKSAEIRSENQIPQWRLKRTVDTWYNQLYTDLFVEGINSVIRFLLCCHCDKTESLQTPGPSSALVHDSSIDHLTVLDEQLLQPRVVHLPRKIAHVDFESMLRLAPRCFHQGAPWSRSCLVPRLSWSFHLSPLGLGAALCTVRHLPYTSCPHERSIRKDTISMFLSFLRQFPCSLAQAYMGIWITHDTGSKGQQQPQERIKNTLFS